MHVKLTEPCEWEGKRRKAGEVIEVSERTQELNSVWMIPTSEPLTADEKAAEKADKK